MLSSLSSLERSHRRRLIAGTPNRSIKEVHDVYSLGILNYTRRGDPLNALDRLRTLYECIRCCHVCPDMDSEKELRLVEAVDPNSDVMIVSQSLASNQLRRSGINFFQSDGKLGNTGRNIERFLNKFGRTVYPYREVKTPSGAEIPGRRPGRRSVYNTEIVQCYTGRRGSRGPDRVPRISEIMNCYERAFLLQEIEAIIPKLILLMGGKSRNSFYRFYMKEQHPSGLTDHITRVARSGSISSIMVSERRIPVLPIQHASGLNPYYDKMVRDEEYIQLIRGILE